MQLSTTGRNLLHRVLNDSKCLEAKKVEFDQTRLLHPFHIELRRRHVRARVLIQWNERIQRTITNHDTSRVGRRVSEQPFDLLAIIKQALYDFLVSRLFA